MNQPKHFFLQLGIVVALYASIVSFISFLFEVINQVWPDVTTYYYDVSQSGLRFAVSVLVVMFPLFLFLSRLYRKSVQSTPEISEFKMRKWIVYFTLFLSGLTVVIDLIVLINYFLGGEVLTIAFLLKALVVLVVALKVFYFYLEDLKGRWDANPKQTKFVAIILSLVVLASVVVGILLIGSPSKQRDIMQDRDRVLGLANLQQQLIDFYQSKGELPKTLAVLSDPLTGTVVPRDPETGEFFEYTSTSKLSFTLCANFKTESPKEMNSVSYMYPSITDGEHFKHKAERTCFERTIDPEKFPLRKAEL